MNEILDKKTNSSIKDISLNQSRKYIRYAKNLLLDILQQAFLTDLLQYKSLDIEQPVYANIIALNTDKVISDKVKQALAVNKQSSRYSLTGPIALIMRIHRDLLLTSASRLQRLVAGIRQCIAKSKTNKEMLLGFI